MSLRHYLTELDFSLEHTKKLLARAGELKRIRHTPEHPKPLAGRHIALFFEKPSVRTRISFTVGCRELGGDVIDLSTTNTKVNSGEHPEDFARVLGGYVSALVARVFEQEDLDEMASVSKVPVINALSNERHPCQALADILTMQERLGDLRGRKFVFIGEGHNVAASFALLSAQFGANVVVAAPNGFGLKPEILKLAQTLEGKITETTDVKAAAEGADVLNTDTWISMGQEGESRRRRNLFAKYKVDADLMKIASPEAIVMHCLPAIRGEEITREIMYSPQSAIWDQAENRLHAQKALMEDLLN